MKPFILSLMLAAYSAAYAEDVRMTNPNAVSVEILGRSFLYSINYDRAMSEDMAAGFGIGSTNTKTRIGDLDTNQNAVMIPIYMNYYFLRDQGSVFATAGVSLITNHSDVKAYKTATGNFKFSSSAVVPQVGLGYENRGDQGFLFRLTGYATFGDSIAPWAGFTFGYAF